MHDPLNPLTGALAHNGSELLLKHHPIKSMDDTCTSSLCSAPDAQHPEGINPMHERMLSLLLSFLMSGVISSTGISDALPWGLQTPLSGGSSGTEVSLHLPSSGPDNTSAAPVTYSPFWTSQAAAAANVSAASAKSAIVHQRASISCAIQQTMMETAPSLGRSLSASAGGTVPSLHAALSIGRAASLARQTSGGGVEAVLASTSMATSTFMKMLRAGES